MYWLLVLCAFISVSKIKDPMPIAAVVICRSVNQACDLQPRVTVCIKVQNNFLGDCIFWAGQGSKFLSKYAL